MRGYWSQPAATDEVLRDGWYHTGDVVRRDEDGFVHIVDRARDMIISGGYNVYPAELEAVLARHPDVPRWRSSACPIPVGGKRSRRSCVPRREVAEDDILEHCDRLLAGYKRPKSVEFVDALPKGSTGKILRRELRDPYWEGTDAPCLNASSSSVPPEPPSENSAAPLREMSIPALGAMRRHAPRDVTGRTSSRMTVDEFVMGVNLPGSDRSIARQTALHAGIPESTTSYTVDRACCSSLTALTLAAARGAAAAKRGSPWPEAATT